MPTQNPRLTVTLKPSTFAQLREVSRLTGNSQSALIGEILEQAEPVFSRLIVVLTAAESARQELREKTAADMERAQARVEQQLGIALEEFDVASGHLLDDVEAVRRRARRRRAGALADTRGDGAPAGVTTPPSNRGVRSSDKTSKKRGNMRAPGDLTVSRRSAPKSGQKGG
jgi:hypothetical protein